MSILITRRRQPPHQRFTWKTFPLLDVTQHHRIDGVAYSPDMNDIPRESLGALQDLDVWIIDALRYAPHPTHTNVDQALSWIELMKPKRGVLTNMHTDLDYEVLRGKLPGGVVPAFDGMRIAVEG